MSDMPVLRQLAGTWPVFGVRQVGERIDDYALIGPSGVPKDVKIGAHSMRERIELLREIRGR